MFWKKNERAAKSVVPQVITEPDPKPIPAMVMWRIEQTDGIRTVEAHEYVKEDHYVTFYRWTGSDWRNNGWLALNTVTWRHRWVREVVCELNHDYVIAIEESI
jgi:hypothetical protein